MLKERIEADLKDALKKGDKNKVSTLRFLLSSIHNREIELRPSGKALSDDDVLAAITKQAKKRRESIEAFEKGGRADLVEKEKKELGVLLGYLPKQADEAEVRRVVEEIASEAGASGPGDLGRVMGAAMAKLKGRAEGAVVRGLAEEVLAGK